MFKMMSPAERIRERIRIELIKDSIMNIALHINKISRKIALLDEKFKKHIKNHK